jgi:tight adherence protein B
MNDAIGIAGVVLGLAALLAVVLFVIAPPPPRVPIERRLAPGQAHVSALTRATDRTVGALDSAFRGRRALFGAEELELAGVRMSPSAFLLTTFSASTVAALLGVLIGFGTVLAPILAILFAIVAPFGAKLLLAIRTSARRAKFAAQLDDTMQLIAGNLRAGYGLVQALDAVARDSDEPTSSEFTRVVNETRIGRDLNAALEITAARMRSDDFTWASQAIAINRETGGNLAEVLERVGATIRERSQIRRQVAALSAEGRLSAIVLVVLPVVVFILVGFLQPAYLATFFGTIWGLLGLGFALLLLIIGSVWMFAVTRVRF